MVEIQSDILEKIRLYLQLVKERGIIVDDAYLYGSFAQNSNYEWSDIDLAIISESFEGNRMIDIEKILGLSIKVDLRISVLPLNKESLNSFFIQTEVIEKGIKVHHNN